MKIRKDKEKIKLVACFTPQELLNLLLVENMKLFVSLLSLTDKEVNIEVQDSTEKQARSREHSEYWTVIMGLTQEFNRDCEICFQLKDSFNYTRDKIRTLSDLTKYKEDPPDLIILSNKQYFNFELKRYFGRLVFQDVFDFIKNRILVYSVPYNFYITLQPQEGSEVNFNLFKKLHSEIKKGKYKVPLGVISFVFNGENKYMYYVQVYPEFKIGRLPFLSGSDIALKIQNIK